MRGLWYGCVAVGIICFWELVRGGILFCLKIDDANSDIKNSQEISSVNLPDNKDIPANNNVDFQMMKQNNENCMLNFEIGFSKIAAKAMDSIVNVSTVQLLEAEEKTEHLEFGSENDDDFSKNFFGKSQNKNNSKKANGLGSGFVVKIDGNKAYIVTNNHVVDKAKRITIFLADKTELVAEIHAIDERTDLAVLAVDISSLQDSASNLEAIKWGDSENIQVGNLVVAIGNPFGLGSTVTHGIVSAKGRNINLGMKSNFSLIDDFIQHSASINVGNSGGCLLNVQGEVVGVNSVIISPSGGNIGIGFAIPSNLVKQTVDQLIFHKRTLRGWFGAEVQLINSKEAESLGLIKKEANASKIFGYFVTRLVSGSPAEKAGVKKGDIIAEFEGQKFSEKNTLSKFIAATKIHTYVTLKILRQTKDTNKWVDGFVRVKIGDFEEAMKSGIIDPKNIAQQAINTKELVVDDIGITIKELPKDFQKDLPFDSRKYDVKVKVVVTDVDDSKMLFGASFAKGDGILQANNTKIENVDQLKEIVELVKKNHNMLSIPFVVQRGAANVIVVVNLEIDEETKKQPDIAEEKEESVNENEEITSVLQNENAA